MGKVKLGLDVERLFCYNGVSQLHRLTSCVWARRRMATGDRRAIRITASAV